MNSNYWFGRKANALGWRSPRTWQGYLWLDVFLLIAAADILWMITTTTHVLVAFIKFLIILVADFLVFRYVSNKKGQN